MTPLDLRERQPRRVRETLLGYYLLPRTIDKIRAELPGGHLGAYVNDDDGLSAFVVKRLGLAMDALRDVVARAETEDEVVAWLAERIDPSGAETLNAKLETFVFDRLPPELQALVRSRHPVMNERPDLVKTLDIIDAEDLRTA